MKRVLLVGGGHAHLHVLRDMALRPWDCAELTLISPFNHHQYSGMVPGYLQGEYQESDIAFDLPRLCRAAGARFIRGFATRVDAAGRFVEVDGQRITFDIASVDAGSAPVGMDVPGVQEHACTVRPMNRALAIRERVDELVAKTPKGGVIRVCVVGSGAAGVEVSLALARRIEDGGSTAEVVLLDRGAVLAGYSERARRRAARILRDRGILVQTGLEVRAVSAQGVELKDGQSFDADLVVWMTGASPPDLLAASDLPRNAEGFFRVDSALRSADGAPVWGAGDCVSLDQHPNIPKAGVYAVREAPVLTHNLRSAVEGGSPREYHPQSSFLSLLNTADGKALLRWHAITSHSRWAWRLKDHIDRRFVRDYATVG